MRSAQLAEKPRYPASWQAFSAGEQIRAQLEQKCAQLSTQMFGYHLVKLGALTASIDLPKCPIRHQVSLGHKPESSAVVTNPLKLPLQESSVDAFVMALELDFSRDPHQLLREVDRSLTANGSILIAGLNPLSLSGITRFSPLYRRHPLKQARFFTAGRVKDWLQLLHYDIVQEHYLLHESVFASWHFPYSDRVKSVFERYVAWSGSAYCLLAKKRTIPMTRAKQRWQAKPRFVPVRVATRTAVSNTCENRTKPNSL